MHWIFCRRFFNPDRITKWLGPKASKVPTICLTFWSNLATDKVTWSICSFLFCELFWYGLGAGFGRQIAFDKLPPGTGNISPCCGLARDCSNDHVGKKASGKRSRALDWFCCELSCALTVWRKIWISSYRRYNHTHSAFPLNNNGN